MAGQFEDVGLRARIDGVAGYTADAKKIQAENAKIEKSLRDSAAGMNREASNILGALKPLAGAIAGAFAVKVGVDAFKGVVSAASDLNETVNKVQVVFGDASTAVQQFADNSAQALGLSRNEALGAAATFGNLFKSMGIGDTQSAEFSTNLLKLSADLASFNNIDPTEVLEKLRSGLVGETEPLRSLGVLIDEETVKNFAYQKGIAAVGAELTQQQKVQARYALIVAQTATAQGDFAATSTGIANSTRIISASFKDIQAEIGSRLLPVVQPLISGFATALPQAFAAAQPWLDRAGEAIQAFATAIQGIGFQQVTSAIQPLLSVFAQLGGDLLQFAQRVGPSLVSIYLQIFKAVNSLQPPFQIWQAIIKEVGATLQNVDFEAFESALDGIASAVEAVADPMGQVMTTVRQFGNVVQATMDSLADQALPVIQSVADAFVSTWQDIEPLVGPALEGVATMVRNFLGEITDFWDAHGAQILAVTKSVFEGVGVVIKTSLDVIRAFVKPILRVLAGDWKGAWEDIQKIPAAVLGAINAQIQKGMEAAKIIMRLGVEALGLEDKWYNLRDFVLTVFNDMTNGIKSSINEIIKNVNNLGTNVNQQLSNLTGGRIKLEVSIPELEMGELKLPERTKWFSAQDQTELDKWKQKLADLNNTVLPETADQMKAIKEGTDEAALAGDNMARRAVPAYQAMTTSAQAAAKAAKDAQKLSAQEIKDSLRDMEIAGKAAYDALKAAGEADLRTLADAGRDLDNSMKAAEATMNRLSNIRLPGQAASEERIFQLGQAQAAARLKEVQDELRKGGQTPSSRIGLQIEEERLKAQLKFAGEERKIQQARDEAAGRQTVEFKTGDEAATAILVAQGQINEAQQHKIDLEEIERAKQDELKVALEDQKAVLDEINLLQSDSKVTMDQVNALAASIAASRAESIGPEQELLRLYEEQAAALAEAQSIINSVGQAPAPQAPESAEPGLATGGRVLSSGTARINERPGERVFLPAGATVMPANTGPANVSRSYSDTFNVYDASRPTDVVDAVRRMLAFRRITQGRQDW